MFVERIISELPREGAPADSTEGYVCGTGGKDNVCSEVNVRKDGTGYIIKEFQTGGMINRDGWTCLDRMRCN